MTATELYISPEGNDQNPGTEAQPLATLERARDAIRELQASGGLPPDGVTVWLKGGVYHRTESFCLSEEDSGTAEAPILYRACPGEEPRLVGGVEVTDFQPVTDPEVLKRLREHVHGEVWQADLTAQGITDLGELRPRGFNRPTVPSALEVFFNGQPLRLARWPGTQYTWITGVPGVGNIRNSGRPEEGFLFEDEVLERWRNVEDLWVYGYWEWDWADSHEKVASLDPDRGLVKTEPPYAPCSKGFRTGQRFQFYNLLEELNLPGEYYVDRKTGRLYLLPPAQITPGSVWVSLLEEPLLKLEGASHVTFRGLTLECARGTGVEISDGEQVTLAGCTIRNLGDWGVRVEGGHGHAVQSCELHDLGEGAISLSGGDMKTLTPSAHRADNNHIHHLGRWCKCYTEAVFMSGVGQRVTHNLIHDLPHIALRLTGAEHLVEFNETHDICLETGDAGVFYLGCNWAEQGNVVRFNFFHHTAGLNWGTNAVYLDDYAAGVLVYGNIIFRGQRGLFINGGREHHIVNNIFIMCNEGAVRINTRPLPPDHPTYEDMRQKMEKVGAFGPPYTERYPDLLKITQHYQANEPIPTEGHVVARNVVIDSDFLRSGTPNLLEALEAQNNVVGVRLEDIVEGCCTLRADSPVWPSGWEPIPFDQIGLYADDYRLAETLPRRTCFS